MPKSVQKQGTFAPWPCPKRTTNLRSLMFKIYLLPLKQELPAGIGLDLRSRWELLLYAAMEISIKTVICALGVVFFFVGCAGDRRHHVVISAAQQKMVVLRDGEPIAAYPVSTSKFGLGDRPGSYATPTGKFRIKEKIGGGAPLGAVFKSRKFTGEILPVDAPGRDPIVTRILWLEGMESGNRNAYGRFIYIHGTPEERTIGTATSYGCIRMKSMDVAALYDTVGVGARVTILPGPFPPAKSDH